MTDLAQKQRTDLDMLQDALASLNPPHLMDAVLAHIEARPDLIGDDLERFSDAIRRKAWALQRQA